MPYQKDAQHNTTQHNTTQHNTTQTRLAHVLVTRLKRSTQSTTPTTVRPTNTNKYQKKTPRKAKEEIKRKGRNRIVEKKTPPPLSFIPHQREKKWRRSRRRSSKRSSPIPKKMKRPNNA
ncbi:hypothetical protein ACJQWK_01044 [Exserohilum turcicum]